MASVEGEKQEGLQIVGTARVNGFLYDDGSTGALSVSCVATESAARFKGRPSSSMPTTSSSAKGCVRRDSVPRHAFHGRAALGSRWHAFPSVMLGLQKDKGVDRYLFRGSCVWVVSCAIDTIGSANRN